MKPKAIEGRCEGARERPRSYAATAHDEILYKMKGRVC